MLVCLYSGTSINGHHALGGIAFWSFSIEKWLVERLLDCHTHVLIIIMGNSCYTRESTNCFSIAQVMRTSSAL